MPKIPNQTIRTERNDLQARLYRLQEAIDDLPELTLPDDRASQHHIQATKSLNDKAKQLTAITKQYKSQLVCAYNRGQVEEGVVTLAVRPTAKYTINWKGMALSLLKLALRSKAIAFAKSDTVQYFKGVDVSKFEESVTVLCKASIDKDGRATYGKVTVSDVVTFK